MVRKISWNPLSGTKSRCDYHVLSKKTLGTTATRRGDFLWMVISNIKPLICLIDKRMDLNKIFTNTDSLP
jgi:hypothetical protein